MRLLACTLFTVLCACAVARAPAPGLAKAPAAAQEDTKAKQAEYARKLARAVAELERFGRVDNGWSPPRPAKDSAEQLHAFADQLLASDNGC